MIKENYMACSPESTDSKTVRSRWIIDKDIPIFKGEGRKDIEQLINVGEE